jgi:hypothetical protein
VSDVQGSAWTCPACGAHNPKAENTVRRLLDELKEERERVKGLNRALYVKSREKTAAREQRDDYRAQANEATAARLAAQGEGAPFGPCAECDCRELAGFGPCEEHQS